MQNLSHYDLLAQVQTAAQQEDWSLAGQLLHVLILDEDAPLPSKTLFAQPQMAEQLLDLSLQVLHFGNFEDRWEIAKVLPQFGTEIIQPLLDLLRNDNSDPEVQWFVIRILGRFAHPAVVVALIQVLQTSDNEDLNGMAVMALAQMGTAAIAPLAELLQQDSTRLLAVMTLGQIRHSETVPLLLTVVQDADAKIRAIAIEALSSFHAPEITEVLLQALQDLSPIVRASAVTGLGFCNEKLNLIEPLRLMLRDFDLQVCIQAALTLGRIPHPDVVVALSEVLRSPHTPEPLALEVVRALGWVPLPEALDSLHQAMDLSETVQLEVVQTLGRVESLQPLAAQGLLKILVQQPASAPLRQAIATALGQLGDPNAIDPLIQLLADPDEGVRLHVVAALRSLDSESAHYRLQALVETAEPNLKQGVMMALQEW